MTHTDGNRNEHGRFIKGNRAGKGRPIGSRVDALRRALIEAVTADDIREIISAVITQAKNGDLNAAKLVLNQVLGNPAQMDIIERSGLARLEDIERKDRKDDWWEDTFGGAF